MVKAGAQKRTGWSLLACGALLFTAICALLPAFVGVPAERDSVTILRSVTVSVPTPNPLPNVVGLPLDETHINTAIQDATGRIWGINTYTLDAFHAWNGTKWNAAAFAPAKGAKPVALSRANDGAVLCLWYFDVGEKPVKQLLLTEHNGNHSRVVARWKGEVSSPFRVFRSRQATWISFNGTDIYRVQNGTARRVYQIAPSQMHAGDPSSPPSWQGPNVLEILEDERGHFWFWSNEFSSGFNNLSLRGLLEFDGKTWIHHPRISGLPDKPFTALVPHGPHNWWAALGDVGLFEIDTRTWKGTRIKDPIPFAFENVQKIEQVGGNWFLAANAPEARYPTGDFSLRDSDLWRWRATTPQQRGHFERILRGLDRDGEDSARIERPFVATPTGLWVGALSGGAWWIPFDEKRKPVHLDWRRGFPLSDVSTLLAGRDGRLLASSYVGTAPDLRAYLAVAPAQSPATFTSYGTIMEDARHHFWRVPDLHSRVLQEWDGARWKSYALPATYSLTHYFYASPDARGRVWLLPDNTRGNVAVLSPATRSWQVFSSFPLALEHGFKTLGASETARLKIGIGKYLMPRFGSSNRIAFRDGDEKLFFFDGHVWRNWTAKQITGQKTVENYEWEETPYFDASGVLSANIADKTWKWTPKNGWKAVETQAHPFPETPTPTPPPGCGVSDPESITQDTTGAIWMIKNRQLWKAAWGLCAPQLSPTERHPLRDGQSLERVGVDVRGQVLLGLGSQWRGESVWLSSPAPQTQLSVSPRGKESFLLRFSAVPSGKKRWFRWRMDNEAWSAPRTGSSLQLDFVPAGTHRFEVAAISEALQLDPTPATATLRVDITPGAQLNRFLSMLRSPDYTRREVAVKAFARQPARALPVLQAARRDAKGEALWWIDAAIQEIENGRGAK